MKLLFLLPLFFQTHSKFLFANPDTIIIDTYEVRLAPWPISMKRIIGETDTCYYLEFRDQHVMNHIALKVMEFEKLEQLKYFEKGLSYLKTGNTGDIAQFENYSIKKVSAKKDDAWYILSFGEAITNFQLPQANRMINIIKKLE